MTTTRNYTGHGWTGSNYDSSLRVSDITKILRDTLKKNYPGYKFSVTKDHHSALTVALMAAPIDVFATPTLDVATASDLTWGPDFFLTNWKNAIAKGHHDVNHYWIKDSRYLTPAAKTLFTDVVKLINSFNYDDSDIMTDYFDTNFYLTLSVGKWDKPFIKTTN